MRRLFITIGLIVGMSGAITTPVYAADVFKPCGGSNSPVCANRNQNQITGGNSIFKRIVNALLYVTGAIAVIMLVIGGLRYVLSGGDSSSINSAKDTIIYALVGIVIAFFAYAMVNWVLGRLV